MMTNVFMENEFMENDNPLTPNNSMTSTMTTNFMDYSISESVRTDGYDLLIDTDALIHYLQIDHRVLRMLRGRYEDRNFRSVNIDFPKPIRIKGRNFWRLSEIRSYDLADARFLQCEDDIHDIIKGTRKTLNKNLDCLEEQLYDRLCDLNMSE
jgi:hypothetical protein